MRVNTTIDPWVLRQPAVCASCDTVMGVGELVSNGGTAIRHIRCPIAKPCKECNIQHAGECP